MTPARRLLDAPRARLVAVALVVALVAGSVASVGLSTGLLGATASEPISFARDADAGFDYADHAVGVGNGNAGVYVLDYDNDGWSDLLAVGSGPALFRNTGGAFARTNALGNVSGRVKSAAVVDYDGDGWPDVLLLRERASPVAFHNDGGTFERVDLGLGNLTYPLGGAAADYDGDGDRDLLVIQSGDWAKGKPEGYAGVSLHVSDDNGNPNVLYENTADGFRRAHTVVSAGEHWSLATSFVDLTGDGRPDVHVANDYNNDTVYVNTGSGFEKRFLGGNTARNGMESAIADVNGDGRPDVFVTNIYLPISTETMSAARYNRLKRLLAYVIHSSRTKGNTLLVNTGNGTFADRAPAYDVRHGGWGWAADFADLDHDGDQDLLHTTQKVVRINRSDPVYTYPMLFERAGDSFERLDASERGFLERDSRGMVTLDYDRDGDLDAVTATYGGEYVVYENTLPRSTNSLEFRVVDDRGATALGAVVTVRTPAGEQTRYVTSETGFLSQSTRVQHVGVGSAETVTLAVTWPDGTKTVYRDVAVNQRVRVTKDGVETVAAFADAGEKS